MSWSNAARGSLVTVDRYDVMNSSICALTSAADGSGDSSVETLDALVCDESEESSLAASGVPRPAQTYAATIAATAATAATAIQPQCLRCGRAAGGTGAGRTVGSSPVRSRSGTGVGAGAPEAAVDGSPREIRTRSSRTRCIDHRCSGSCVIITASRPANGCSAPSRGGSS